MTYLDAIVDWHRRRATSDSRDTTTLLGQATTVAVSRRAGTFRDALCEGSRLNVIAEVKRRSPSKGDIDLRLDPGVLAAEYTAGGAAAVSVLTDGPHFGGSPEDLVAARAGTPCPILRKDFTVDARDVMDACLMGADAVLLIAAVLTDEELVTFRRIATQLRMTALVEVHDEDEMERALAIGADVVGVNQRNLSDFRVDPERAVRMAARIPTDVVAVAESGIESAGDAERCARAGYRAVLVGEHLVRSTDRAAAVRELRVPLPS